MPLVLGTRADVAPKDKPQAADRSGLDADDWRLIALDNAIRQAHYATEDETRCTDKLRRLDALLDDPALAATHPPDHPDRLAAVTRHAELHHEAKRFRAEARRAAKEAALAWEKIASTDDRAAFVAGFAAGWSDSGVFLLALHDPLLSRLEFWRRTIDAWGRVRGMVPDEPAF